MDEEEAQAIYAAVQIVGVAAQIIVEDDAEYEEMMLTAARVAAMDLMDLEEGDEGLGDFVGDSWTTVTVDIDEYHRMSDRVFRLHFRMGRATFEVLCDTLRHHLVQQGRLKRERTPFQDIVLMIVWLLATPDTFRSVALRFGVTPGTLYYFYSYIIESLRELAPQYICWPNREERLRIQNTFQAATGFPGVVGCIDGTFVNITAPLANAAQYINRHHSYSINVQAVVDCDLLVRDLHVGEVGSINDKRVFRRSPLSESLLRGEGISPDEHLVGDGGYVLTNFMMIPHRNDGHLTRQQKNFNKKLSQCRVRVENAFGRAKGKWRRLKFLHARNQEVVTDHITASFVLHNFLILHGEPMLHEGELAMPIPANLVLGNPRAVGEQDIDNEDDDEMEVAHVVGMEKRLYIMQHLILDDNDQE